LSIRWKINFPNIDVIVGNIATPEAALFLVETAMV
jgi:hypothetical protein